MKSIAVAILNWNGQALLERFLPNVIENSPQGDVIVIDNGSTDDSVSWIRANHPTVEIIELPKNGGYAGGYNDAMKQLKHEFVVLLNSDVEVTPNWLEPLLSRLKSDEKIAAIQPKIRALKEREKFEYAGASGGFIDNLGYPFCRGRIFYFNEEDQGQYDDAREVFWSTGACLAVRTSAYHEVGGLDPQFFAHMEEIDLCWRMQRSGYSCWVEPASTVFHLGGATLSSQSTQKTYLNFRNNLILLTKNLPYNRIFPVILSRLVLDGVAGIQFALKGDIKHTLAIVKAHFHYYGRYGKIMKQRSGVYPWPLPGVYHKSIVRQVFLGGMKKFSQLSSLSFTSSKASSNR